jgi:hypothetical protein
VDFGNYYFRPVASIILYVYFGITCYMCVKYYKFVMFPWNMYVLYFVIRTLLTRMWGTILIIMSVGDMKIFICAGARFLKGGAVGNKMCGTGVSSNSTC